MVTDYTFKDENRRGHDNAQEICANITNGKGLIVAVYFIPFIVL